METNGVNYYKGVLLCSRPNQSPSIPKQKPFCARVTPHDQLGLVPTKKFDEHQVRKRVLPVLNNHKKWLEGFKKKISEKKISEQEQKKKQVQKLQKIKEEGTKRRQQFKKTSSIDGNEVSANVSPTKQEAKSANKQSEQVFKQKKRLMKKGEKPAWAKTAQEKEAQQQQEVDNLLNFFDSTNIEDYMEDKEVSKMLQQLKQRIQLMKKDEKEGDWKKKQVQKIQQAKQAKDLEDKNQQKKDDILSRISRNSQAKSVASQKTTERVEQLQKKKQEKEWDKNTLSDKKSLGASIDQQIAKNVADQVLRNYPALKHHSNQSIRKLLQKQAHNQIKA